VDHHVQGIGRRTDLGEMAQLSAADTLTSLVGRQLPSLFGTTPADVQETFAKLSTSSGFTLVAREFFSRLTNRALGYFLSRELSKHVGPNKRFARIDEHSDFNVALDEHCRGASRIIKEFAGGWYGKTLFREGWVTPEEAKKFAHVAFKKVRAELRKRRDADAA
jgi:hypothetical protein